ncbi:MAG: cytochrome P450 [Phormidesmis sp.]
MQLPSVNLSRLQQLINWIARPYSFLDECAGKYGDIFIAQLFGFPPLVMVSNPQAIKEIFAADAKFDAGRGQQILKPLLGENSLILLDGDRHKRDRKLLMPPFHGAKVKSYGDTICQITREVSDTWQPQQPFLASEAMAEITLEVILQTVFGLREGDRYQQLKALLIRLLDSTGTPLSASMLFFPWLQKDWGSRSPWGKIVRQRQQVYDLLQQEIEDRRQSETAGEDVLSLMLSARDEDGQPMTDVELKDELMTMLVAGHETTATVLTWALYWIHKLPDVKSKLLAELAGLEDRADCMAIATLPYLTAVASETLRIYPIAPITSPRIANQAVTLADHSFPADTILAPSIYLLHHREDLYPEPKAFRPERFLKRQFSPSEFIPFGGGNRRCLGYALAKLEINLVLATILTHHSLKLADEQPVTPRRRGVLVAASNGVPLVLDD